MKIERILLIIFGLLFLGSILGGPDEINFFGFKWELTEEGIQQVEAPKLEPKIYDIVIEEFESRQQIYQPGDTAHVEFVVKNTLNISYNLTVDWLYNNRRDHGWSNVSTLHYPTYIEENPWDSWYTVQQRGEWEVHLVIKYVINNQNMSKDAIARFKVV